MRDVPEFLRIFRKIIVKIDLMHQNNIFHLNLQPKAIIKAEDVKIVFFDHAIVDPMMLKDIKSED